MKKLLNWLPVLFLAGGLYSAYALYTSESALLPLVPLTVSATCAFFTSLSWLVSPAGKGRSIAAVLFLLTLITGAYFCIEPTAARTVWMFMCFLVLASVHTALFAIAASSFLFSEGRKTVLALPVVLSAIGAIGLFAWNGKLGTCYVGLAAAIILAMIATLFGMPKKKKFKPEDN